VLRLFELDSSWSLGHLVLSDINASIDSGCVRHRHTEQPNVVVGVWERVVCRTVQCHSSAPNQDKPRTQLTMTMDR
jgi:hypothetical protein